MSSLLASTAMIKNLPINVRIARFRLVLALKMLMFVVNTGMRNALYVHSQNVKSLW